MTPGTLVCAYSRYAAQYAPDPGGICATGYWRVTAVRADCVWVDHVVGARHADGINGWDNQWFELGDPRVVVVEGV